MRAVWIILGGIGLLALGFVSFPTPHRQPGGVAGGPASAAVAPVATQVVDRTTPAPRRSFDWRQVESPDYRTYVANLRAIGCPEETVQDIILADVGALYEKREQQVRAELPRFEFWRTDVVAERAATAQQLRARLQQLRQEKRAVILTLLGPGAADRLKESPEAEVPDLRLDFMTEAQQRRAAEIERQSQGQIAEVLLGASVKDPAFADEDPFELIRRRRTERDEQLTRLLGEAGKAEYDVRASPTADLLRRKLGAFNPTEAEFREILRQQKAIDDEFGLQFNPFGGSGDGEARARMSESLQVFLGEARYAEFQQAAGEHPAAAAEAER